MFTFLLILHGLVAVALMGSITHQTLAACWPAPSDGLFHGRRSAPSTARATPTRTSCSISITFVLGGIIYTAYRLAVSPYLVSARLNAINGSFELKEQFAAIGLGMLPLYWLVWRQPLEPRYAQARAAVTAILCFIVWYSFLVGHVLNNVRGLFGQMSRIDSIDSAGFPVFCGGLRDHLPRRGAEELAALHLSSADGGLGLAAPAGRAPPTARPCTGSAGSATSSCGAGGEPAGAAVDQDDASRRSGSAGPSPSP